MRTPANIAKHPIHPMLVTIPIGLWLFSLVCDLIYVFGADAEVWRTVAFYNILGGIVGALLAAIPGLIDMLALPAAPRRTAIVHMALNLTVVALFVINVFVRYTNPDGYTLGVWLSVIAVALLAVSGWLGGKMVYEYGVAVDNGEAPARLNLHADEHRAVRH